MFYWKQFNIDIQYDKWCCVLNWSRVSLFTMIYNDKLLIDMSKWFSSSFLTFKFVHLEKSRMIYTIVYNENMIWIEEHFEF